MNAIVQASQTALVAQTASVTELRARATKIRQAMKSVMESGIHYGVIPGTGKPSLYKPGSETLLSMFHISCEPIVEDLSTEDCIRYRVTARGVHAPTGTVIGFGIGEASTGEEKYKWRKAYNREWNATDVDRRRIKYGWDKEKREEYEILQVRTEPADLANTVLKMAKKRAQIDMTLTALAASDVFNQDLEDLQAELRETIMDGDDAGDNQQQSQHQGQRRGRQQTQAPRSRASNGNGGGTGGGNGRCTEKQVKLLGMKLDHAGIPPKDFLTHFKIADIAELPFAKVNEALQWIQNPDSGSDDTSDDDGDRSGDIGDGRQAGNGW